MAGHIIYTDTNNEQHTIVGMGQGPAVPITSMDPDTGEETILDSEAYQKDQAGFTHPNLHRRIDPPNEILEGELEPRKYSVGIHGVNSYRFTYSVTHDEDTETSEIP